MLPRYVSIAVYPRLHIGLLSMHSGGPRINGGIGFAVDHPRCIIEARPKSGVTILDERERPLSRLEREQLSKTLENAAESLGVPAAVELRITGGMSAHVGLGSGTAIRLGSLEAFCLLYRVEQPRNALVALSGRGGTSGIGINTYFDGGLVLDLGKPACGSSFEPSSAIKAPIMPLALTSIPLPDWPIGIYIPSSCASKTQSEEIAFFNRTAPIDPAGSYYATYEALFGLYASAVEGDYKTFVAAINGMQSSSWKSAEWLAYGESIFGSKATLMDAGLSCIGLSSLGPLLFALGDHEVLTKVGSLSPHVFSKFYLTKPRNRGREIMCVQDA